jgi:hypothetical protein
LERGAHASTDMAALKHGLEAIGRKMFFNDGASTGVPTQRAVSFNARVE